MVLRALAYAAKDGDCGWAREVVSPLVFSLDWAPLRGSTEWLMAINEVQKWLVCPNLCDEYRNILHAIDPARGAVVPTVGETPVWQRVCQTRDAFVMADFLVRQQASGLSAEDAHRLVAQKCGLPPDP